MAQKSVTRGDWVLQQWAALCSDIGVVAAMSGKWGDHIRSRYSEQGRFYHTLEHLADMLEGAERDFETFRNPNVVRLAIFFHDLVYTPKSSTNEEDSEALFRNFSEEVALKPSDSCLVSAYIIATKNHDVSGSNDLDLRAFIDLDMAVIGRDRVDYLEYASQIRSEYIHVPAETFCRKRAKILGQFLTTQHIYATDLYRRDREAKARANIEAEISLLEAGNLPGFRSEATPAPG